MDRPVVLETAVALMQIIAPQLGGTREENALATLRAIHAVVLELYALEPGRTHPPEPAICPFDPPEPPKLDHDV